MQTTYTKKISIDDENGLHTLTWTPYLAVGSNTPCADYTYDSTNDTETFRIFDSRSNRSEIRLVNEYSTGRRQFEGYVTFYSPLENESLMQIFGSTTGATLMMTRGYSASGGSITVTSTGGGVTYGSRTILAGCYGQEHRINVIHDQDNYVRWYVDGVLKCEQRDTETNVINYWKYGCYGTTSGNVPAIVRWRAVKTFTDGLPPETGVTPTPDRVTVAQGSSVTGTVNVSAFGGNTALILNGLPSGASASFNPSIVSNGQGSSILTITVAGIATGEYPLRIIATDGITNRAATLMLGVLPPGWLDADVGEPGKDGGASCSNGVFTVNGGGSDIWGGADKFNFAYQPFSGDLTMSARVDTQQNTSPWAKAGLMIRESTNAGSKYVGIYVTPGNGVSMQYRSTNDSAAVDFARNTGVIAPYWVRLTRAGNTFTGYRSANGVNWMAVGAVTMNLAGDALVGLPVSAHDDTVLNVSTFSHVSLPSNLIVPPRIGRMTAIGANLVFAGSNGVPGWPYYVLVTTNLSLPVNQWTPIATNYFDSQGAFAFTNEMNDQAAQQLYLLEVP